MSRRGVCRCGTVLKFASGPNGYKMRCPTCGAVVRLRAEAHDAADGPRQRQKSGVLAFHPPAPSDPEVPYEDNPLIRPEQFDYDELRPGELPVVEMVPLSELMASPPPLPSRWRWPWWLLTMGIVVAAATVGIVIALK